MQPYSISKIGSTIVITAVLSMSVGLSVHAEEPVSKCLTVASESLHANALARLKKDIAPYLADQKDNAAIQAYQDALTVAWSAMHEPYCGYGKEGAKSAIKSFGKSIDRARTAFLESVKNHAPVKAVPSIASEPAMIDDTTSTPPIVVPKTSAQKLQATRRVFHALRRGMRHADVLNLQKILAHYFNLSEKDLATGYFGPKTEELLIKLQLEKKIINSKNNAGAGLVGPKTSAVLQQL